MDNTIMSRRLNGENFPRRFRLLRTIMLWCVLLMSTDTSSMYHLSKVMILDLVVPPGVLVYYNVAN